MSQVHIPPPLAALAQAEPRWAEWISQLPRRAQELMSQWELRADGPAYPAHDGLVLPVLADRGAAVLKIALPDEDGAGEIAALKTWQGRGAVELWRADPRHRAMLLQRAGQTDADALPVLAGCEAVAGLYGLLHVPAGPTVPPLEPLVRRWLRTTGEARERGLPAPPRLVARALELGEALLSSTEELRVVHGDLHGGNVLTTDDTHGTGEGSTSEGSEGVHWLAIDPKGFAGDPCFEPAPLLWNRWAEATRYGNAATAVRSRFYAITETAGLDEARCRDWVIVRAIIHASWEVRAAGAAGHQLGAAARERITRYITVAKAMDEVIGGW